jgi:predicted protein tyrosine phosphatase
VAVGHENAGRAEERSSSETVPIAVAAEARVRRRTTKRTVEKEAMVERNVRTADWHPRNLRELFEQPTRNTETVVAVTILQDWLEKENTVDFVEKVGLPWPRAREMVLHCLDFVGPSFDRSMHASHAAVV